MKTFTDGDFDYGDACGIGSSGCVYKAIHKATGRLVAIKKINGIDRNEANVWSTLKHPTIIEFLGIIKPPNFAIVTEFATNGNLLDYLADESKPLKAELLMKWIRQITQGMHYLHSRKEHVIHRDLKSPNILLDEDYNVKLCDFGTAKQIDTTTTNNAHKTVVGSYPWMAPEIMAGSTYNGHTDTYSFAVVVWELITRLSPFDKWNNPDIIQCVFKEQKRLPLPAECPKELLDIIDQCWHHQSNRRPSFETIMRKLNWQLLDSEDFRQRLQEFLDDRHRWKPTVQRKVDQLLAVNDERHAPGTQATEASVNGHSNVIIQHVQGGTFYLSPGKSTKREVDDIGGAVDDVDSASLAKRQKLNLPLSIKPLATLDTLVAPRGVKATKDGKIIVNLGDNYEVLVYEIQDGTWTCVNRLFGQRGSKPLHFNFNTGLTINSAGHLLIADTGNDRIQEVTNDGRFVREIGRLGRGEGELSRPFDVAVDYNDNMYVCDLNNHRVQVFSPDGSFVRVIGSEGTEPGQLQYPLALDINQSVVYVTSESHYLQGFDLQGNFRQRIGGKGTAPGQFSAPKGVAVDKQNGFILVADSDNCRVQIFNLQMEFLALFGDKSMLGHPHSVSVLQDGSIVVSDYGKGKVVIFPSALDIVKQTKNDISR